MQVVEHAVALGFAEIRRYTQRPSGGKPATEVDNLFRRVYVRRYG